MTNFVIVMIIGKRTSCHLIWSLTILVIKQIGLQLCGRPVLLPVIVSMIADRIGLHSVLLPLLVDDGFRWVHPIIFDDLLWNRSRFPTLVTAMIITKQVDQSLPILCGGVGWRGERGEGTLMFVLLLRVLFAGCIVLDWVWKSKVTSLGPLPISLTVTSQQQPLATLPPKMAIVERLGCS